MQGPEVLLITAPHTTNFVSVDMVKMNEVRNAMCLKPQTDFQGGQRPRETLSCQERLLLCREHGLGSQHPPRAAHNLL